MDIIAYFRNDNGKVEEFKRKREEEIKRKHLNLLNEITKKRKKKKD